MRMVLGLIAGLAAAVVTMLAIAYLGGLAYPTPGEIDARDPEQISSVFAGSPLGAKLSLLVSWFGGALVGGLVARRLSLWRGAAWVIAGIVAVYALATSFVLPMPAWMQVVSVVAPLLGGLLAAHVGGSRPVAGRETTNAEV